MELEGKLAMVTGAGSGIGRASAVKLAAAGADVAVLSREPHEVDAVADEIEGLGRRALRIVADISSEGAVKAGFDTIADRFGRLDIVFANAGINGVWAPLRDLTYDEWNRTMAVNLGGTFLTLHHSVPLMMEAGGSIVITASMNGTRVFTTAGSSAYSASKAGQVALAQMAALELARYRIRVNVICPGAIETKINESTVKRNVEEARVPANYPEGRIPLTRGARGRPEDVADLVQFLASDRAAHVSGTPIWIDGAESLLI